MGDAEPTLVVEQPIGQASVQLIPSVGLDKGRNAFQASIVGPGQESELSAIATWVLDTSKPKLTIISPEDGSSTNKDNVTIKGKTQAGSSVRLKNDDNGATATVDANKDGLFEGKIRLSAGLNAIQITTVDPAGNPNDASLTIRKGSGKTTAKLTATAYQFRTNRLPKQVTFTVQVTDPDGKPIADATALFTVSVPGLEAIVSGEIRTNENGTARFTTSIPKGAMKGSGLATVLVDTGRVRHPHRSPGADRPLTGQPPAFRPGVRAATRSPRQVAAAQLRSPHAGLALPALRHPAGGKLSLLGVSTVDDDVRDLSSLPPRHRQRPRAVRPRSASHGPRRHRDPGVLDGRRATHRRAGRRP